MKKITLLLTFFIATISFGQYNIDDTQTISFIDISTTGTDLSLSDDQEMNITTPWTVYLGQQATTNLRVGNNGAILFGVTSGEVSAGNTHLTTAVPMVAPFWDDFDAEVGSVYYETKDIYYAGVLVGSKFIIQWDRVHYSGSSNVDPASFQVVFYRDSKKIEFIYADVDMDGTSYDNGNSATIGVATQDAVTEYSYNTPSLNGVTSLVFTVPKTYIPDDNFEAYLEANGMGDGISNNDYVLTANIENVTNLTISNLNISDLTGIADFTALTFLDCGNNSLTTLDMSSNPALTYLNCYQNGTLASLNVTQNTLLETLLCSSNSLTSLDVSNNLQLVQLSAYQNNINTLDVSLNTLLTSLSIHHNNLLNLDVTNNTLLEVLSCSTNQLNELDLTHNTNLSSLTCSDNNLTVLDLSQNTQLTILQAYTNDLLHVDLLTNTLLEKVWLYNNPRLTTINVRNGANNLLSGTITIGTTVYAKFRASDCPNLSCVFVDNALNATNGDADYLNWEIDPNGHYVETQSDCENYYATAVPDDNFEAYLETHNAAGATVALGATDSMGNGVLNDNVVPTIKIDALESLNVGSQSIADLTGIEDFISLTQLLCGDNNLSSLDISNNTALEKLYCADNNLTALDVTQNVNLKEIYLSFNNVSNLDLSQNLLLERLATGYNTNLSVLDLSHNTALVYLSCYYNIGLNNLDLSQNTLLNTLDAYSNRFTEINLDTNSALAVVRLFNNPNLVTIHIQNGANNLLSGTYSTGSISLPRFKAIDCPNLSCIFVDNASDATAGINDYQDWAIDANATYVQDIASCDALYIGETSLLGLQVYPNPTRDTVTISMGQQDDYTIKVYNLLGKQVLSQFICQNNEAQIALTNLPNGVYMMRVFADSSKEGQTIRIIKKQ